LKKAIAAACILCLVPVLNGIETKITLYPFLLEGQLEHDLPDPFPELESLKLTTQRNVQEEIVKKAKTLEAQLLKRIFGQDEAVQETTNAILRFAAGVNDPSMPIACLLYCGPSGVGKTELAKQLSIELYGKSSHFFRINMSEYSEPHSISRLIGSPPGYVGYESGGGLSNRLRDNPYSVILLDEIEKAHPKILKLFMHIFDAGYFTSARGEDVDCRRAIFILTSNLASSEIADLHHAGMSNGEILEILKPFLMDALSPEMFNRLDCMVFSPLSDEIFEMLIKKLLNELKMRITQSKGIDIFFGQSIVDYLKGYSLDPKLGARPLKRIIEKELATVIARAILDNQFKKGDAVMCDYQAGNIQMEVILSEEKK